MADRKRIEPPLGAGPAAVAALERMATSEKRLFDGQLGDGSRLSVRRVIMPSVELALASGTLERLPDDASDEQVLAACPDGVMWFVIWSGTDAHEWPSDVCMHVFSRIEQWRVRQQTWIFHADPKGVRALCWKLWGVSLDLPAALEPN